MEKMCEITKDDVIRQLPELLKGMLESQIKFEKNEVISEIKCDEDKEKRRTECFTVTKEDDWCVTFDINTSYEHFDLCKDVAMDIYMIWAINKEKKEERIIIGTYWDSIHI